MKVPVNWLKDFVDIDMSIEQLSDKLVSCGFEIEEVINLGDKIKNVVTAKIVSIEKHPNADKLSICNLNIGNKNIVVVTGADNIAIGDIVPVALDGSFLNGKVIQSGELRGVLSEGMLCSGAELCLTEADFIGASVDGILILEKNTPIGENINNIIGNNDIVLDVSITANRQDCNSILGIAREIAAITSQKLRMPSLDFTVSDKKVGDYISVENTNYVLCPRYMAMVVEDIKLERSPKYIRDRLRAVGIRPINNLVDITNYVLIEIGQPLHAFDLELLKGNKIIVREAKANESLVALDGKKYSFDTNDLLICDIDKPVAVAGVMGGEYSSVNDNTATIVIESANFAKDSVRHTSRKLNLRSDSSQRFEKGIDMLSQEIGLKRALSLMDKHGWGRVVDGNIDCLSIPIVNEKINCKYQEINKILGINVDKYEICKVLNLLEIQTKVSSDNLDCTIPIFRTDMAGVNDLAEEVIRIYGYEHITPTLLNDSKMTSGGKSRSQLLIDKIKSILVSHGLYEIINYSFITPNAFDMLRVSSQNALRSAIKIRNPLGEELSVMRTTLAYSMIKTMASNIVRGNKEARFFEYAKTYTPIELPIKQLPREEYCICIGFYGDSEDYYTIKSVIEDILATLGIIAKYTRSNLEYLHPGRGADIVGENNNIIGYVGEVLPDVADEFDIDKRLYIAELSVQYLIDYALQKIEFQPMSKYQAVDRDLALIMDKDLDIATVLNKISSNGSNLLEDIKVFDTYEGAQVAKGKKSVAISLRFRHFNRTLIEEEINNIINNILNALNEINVRLRY